MKNGICIKCQSREVWKTDQKISKNGRVGVNLLHDIHLDRYCCLACGFCEEYIAVKDLQNGSKMDAVRRNFEKV